MPDTPHTAESILAEFGDYPNTFDVAEGLMENCKHYSYRGDWVERETFDAWCTSLARSLAFWRNETADLEAMAVRLQRKNEELTERLAEVERALSNLVQDSCENALVPVSLLDEARRALHELDPNHPALTTYAPAFGVWESLRAERDRLAAIVQRVRELIPTEPFTVNVGDGERIPVIFLDELYHILEECAD